MAAPLDTSRPLGFTAMPADRLADAVTLHVGDCRKALPPLGVFADSVVTDPPYELGFMGKSWDSSGVAFDPATWATAMKAVKPGGYMLAFAGSRTQHRIGCAIEDGGWEIRDCLMWLYGTGFPKGKGCLKPAYEPIILARRPGPRVLPLGVDECRVPAEPWVRKDGENGAGFKSGKFCGTMGHGEPTQANGTRTGPAGRYPANVLHDGSEEVMEAFAAFGEKGGGFGVRGSDAGNKTFGGGRGLNRPATGQTVGLGDTGTAARFFYSAKASKSERGEGNTHPTVKPLALMRWLVRLITPPGGTVLDCFAGSGTTGLASVAEGRRAVLIERDEQYADILRKRLAPSGRDMFTPKPEDLPCPPS